MTDCLFALLGSVHKKSARKHVDEIDPWLPHKNEKGTLPLTAFFDRRLLNPPQNDSNDSNQSVYDSALTILGEAFTHPTSSDIDRK